MTHAYKLALFEFGMRYLGPITEQMFCHEYGLACWPAYCGGPTGEIQFAVLMAPLPGTVLA